MNFGLLLWGLWLVIGISSFRLFFCLSSSLSSAFLETGKDNPPQPIEQSDLVVATGHNLTNLHKDATRHAEIVAYEKVPL